uniref:eIF-2-alpha kinase activator GCN1 n=1 Tax=Ciona intestinalis TaxID=7719 RepID=UPI0005217462|nr:eIF-2-alpha kinase activator GCN1 [Ciona intestinalis]|eukprot:XP_009858208.1 eIF-2-alpha kinase activator GCN1 [Ciona intestinalis]
MESLKTFVLHSTVFKVTKRISMIDDVISCVKTKKDIQNKVIQLCIVSLSRTLGLYNDAKSRNKCIELIRRLMENYKKVSVAALLDVLDKEGRFHVKNKAPSRSASAQALVALSWSCVLMGNLEGDDVNKLVAIQASLYYGSQLSQSKSISSSGARKIRTQWKQNPNSFDSISKILLNLDLIHSNCCLLGLLSATYPSSFEEKKNDVFTFYVKSMVLNKVQPLKGALDCCIPILHNVTHQDFEQIILPAFQKSFLRNPENCFATFQSFVTNVRIDLSRHARLITTMLVPQLISKSDSNRDAACDVIIPMTSQCSDSEFVLETVKYLFDVLKGSEGKLTLAGQKCSVLKAVGAWAGCAVGDGNSSHVLASSVATMMVAFLQQELHEGTLITGASSLSSWCSMINIIPPDLISWFVKAPSIKVSTPGVRLGYIECMIKLFKRDNMEMIEPIVPYLVQTLEKARQQSTQIPLVCEAIGASLLLSKLGEVEFKKEQKINLLWEILLDEKKMILTSDKVLQHAPDDVIMILVSLIERMLLIFPDQLSKFIVSRFHHILVHLLLHKPRNVYCVVEKTLKKLMAANSELPSIFLNELFAQLRPALLIDFSAIDDSAEIMKNYVSHRRFTSSLLCLLDAKVGTKASEDIAMLMIPDVYHPCITAANNHVWTDYLYNNKIDARQFISSHLSSICDKLVHPAHHNETSLAALCDVLRIAPDIMMSQVTEYLVTNLSKHDLTQVTKDEVGIMKTKDGALYNMAIIESAPKIAQNKNIKRESKAYSYKEQMMGEELQREIEAKKRGTGGVKGVGGKQGNPPIPLNLTKKQKELVDAEMEREKVIRDKLLLVNAEFNKACDVLHATIKVHSLTTGISHHLVAVLSPLLELLKSPLASERAQQLFVALSGVMMPDHLKKLGIQTAFATLRLYDPSHKVDDAWCAENINDNVARVMESLKKSISTQQPSPCSCYIFPFLHRVCSSTSDVDLILSSLKIIKTQVRIRFDDDLTFDPKLLPRLKVMENTAKLIGTSMVQVQHEAVKVMIGVCESASGKQGCATACDDEIKCLLTSLLSPVAMLRGVALQGLLILRDVVASASDNLLLHVTRRAWVAMHDLDDTNRKLGKELWEIMHFKLESTICTEILEDIQYHESAIQQASAESLYAALESNIEMAPLICEELFNIYNLKLERAAPVIDQLGRVIQESPPDHFEARVGVAHALKKISPVLPDHQIEALFSFFVPDALGDRNPEVAKKMLEAALQAVNDHGKNSTEILLQVFEEFLKNAPTSQSYDEVRQSVVILLGTLARHLDKDHPKVKPIVAKLTETLSTPSQAVQEAVANCLPALVPSIKESAPDIVRKLLVILLESEKYGERKGAAYGLAGMVKGLGIISFKQLDIMPKLTEAIQDKKNFRHREGALLSFEMFCGMLGRLFEPYIVHVLPHLLLCFGDGDQYVRQAADNTARAVMRNLSAHGVRLVLPSLLSALRAEDSWRTKTGSAELLGAMAFCAPKQLSSCLPSIVPKLCEVLTDSHPKVLKAGQQALKQIGSVIRNPEIQAISESLLAALSDPARKTSKCLHTLLNTKFIHFIDAPSLALILPVVERAFQDRSTDTRKMAAQIIGNMYSLTDQKDLNPYLPNIIPGLQNTLLDPVPEVRGIAAKALGAMVEGTGEAQFEELLPWLMEKLTSENSAVDRSGAAQGLSEVIASLGVEKLSNLMPEVIKTAQSDTVLPHVRDGYIMLFVYLPCTFGDDFIPFIGDAIFPILQALADEAEYVRATALLAGRRIITMFASTAVEVLLPQLEKGLFDDNWRIRLSSIQLLGDLLYHVSGVTGKMSAAGGEDDNFGTAEGFKAIVDILGQDRRDLVLSGLYMGRSDVALLVRQSALHVWKIIVPNTPRVLREILPTLFKLLLSFLATNVYDKRQVAAKTLGDIVRKLGERMLPELIPILEKGLDSEDESQRQGVCIGLTEIIKSCSRDAIIVFTDNLVPTVRKALCDPLPEVRVAAATTFEHLHNTIGVQALDEIIPALLRQLKNPVTSENAVDGLRQIISVKGRVVLPFIVPKLIEPPVNTEVLALLSSVAGEALTRHLSSILKVLVQALIDADDFESVKADATKVIHSVSGEQGMRIVIDDLLLGIKNEDVEIRYSSIVLLRAFCSNPNGEFSDYIAVFIQAFIKLLADPDVRVQSEGWETLSVVTGTLDPADMHRHVSSVRHALRFIKNDEMVIKTGTLPGFCLPKKGMAPLLLIFREGILNGHPDLKEQSARGLSECIQYLTPTALKPSVVSITGPLIRILGDRYNSNVRISVIETLSLLLQKVGPFLKPFLPQLQTTFSKALQDANRPVRIQAGIALSHLSFIHARVDPLFTELNNNIKNAEDASLCETHLVALRGCISKGGNKMSDKVRTELTSTLSSQLSSDQDVARRCASGCLGNLCAVMHNDEVTQLLTDHVFVNDPNASWSLRQGRTTLLASALKEAPNKILDQNRSQEIIQIVVNNSKMDRVQIVLSTIHSAAYLVHYFVKSGEKIPPQVLEAFNNGFEHSSNDVKTATCQSCMWVVQNLSINEQLSNGVAVSILPESVTVRWVALLLTLSREKNTTVRSYAESAIVVLLQLRQSDALMTKIIDQLSSRDSNSLSELHRQKLKRLTELKETFEDIDNTIIHV